MDVPVPDLARGDSAGVDDGARVTAPPDEEHADAVRREDGRGEGAHGRTAPPRMRERRRRSVGGDDPEPLLAGRRRDGAVSFGEAGCPALEPGSTDLDGASHSDIETESSQLLAALFGDLVRTPRRH